MHAAFIFLVLSKLCWKHTSPTSVFVSEDLTTKFNSKPRGPPQQSTRCFNPCVHHSTFQIIIFICCLLYFCHWYCIYRVRQTFYSLWIPSIHHIWVIIAVCHIRSCSLVCSWSLFYQGSRRSRPLLAQTQEFNSYQVLGVCQLYDWKKKIIGSKLSNINSVINLKDAMSVCPEYELDYKASVSQLHVIRVDIWTDWSNYQ